MRSCACLLFCNFWTNGAKVIEKWCWNGVDMGDLTRCLIHLGPTPHGIVLLEMELQARDETEIL
jgi:hypothetical protein